MPGLLPSCCQLQACQQQHQQQPVLLLPVCLQRQQKLLLGLLVLLPLGTDLPVAAL
jgi:hypothetical protein